MDKDIKKLDMLLINKEIYDNKVQEVIKNQAQKIAENDFSFEVDLFIGIILSEAFAELRYEFFGKGCE